MENLNNQMIATSKVKRSRQATEKDDVAFARRRTYDLPNIDRGNAADDEGHEDADAIPHIVRCGSQVTFSVGEKLGEGAYGQVHVGRVVCADENWPAGTEVAIKFEHQKSTGCLSGPPSEWQTYESLAISGVPRIYFKGKQGNYYIMIMEKLGPSLWRVWDRYPERFDSVMIASIAIEAISILEMLHSRGFVHADMKPENLLFGPARTPDVKKVFLVDLGLAVRWSDEQTGLHVEYEQRPDRFRGTLKYASVHANLGRTSSRRDDLESLAYSLIFLLCGYLPWQNYHVSSLMFDEEPNYARYISLFTSITGSDEANWPITSHGTWKNILEGDSIQRTISLDEGQRLPKKKTRIGRSQWIIVYNSSHVKMNQRFAYNVENENLNGYLREIENTGFRIRSVACAQNLWALTIDNYPWFTSQVHHLQPFFLYKEWITQRWNEGYYITAIAGADNGCALVIMSNGVSYTGQCYKICNSFPYTWIAKKWKDGFCVTSMATSKSKWAIIMSQNAQFTDQVVEIDFVFPSEGIRRRWEKGYRITATAATSEQFAFILSKHSQMPVNHEQHTQRTLDFPKAEAKERRESNTYITSMCYGGKFLS